ncbi:hypothetical protein DCO58_00435 [Helicobacter saguini]|uniref:Flagellar FliJ protein n=1 Tax=Helicobacter saguini TaxID=1548018 RepID=A0A347VQV7_9HELI|nr:flagellar export protein FliJ [Helicobacter saguini]MWV63140.1 hypothetical protein [Helicobacter saguini]MWV66190.1 hypothetical protein [Helicobacter saguini]MWV68539.1 hypothetical protein [Helicobacter saguini]MWV71906.1 hypothetical protein [Helicobacter saguini]TLD95920.1 hypothetical protein LS64_000720 [Helicobacter saguini]
MLKQMLNLVKVAKQKLDSKERELQRNQIAILRKNEQIDSINFAISNTQMPNGGSFSTYQIQREAINAHLYEIEEIKGQIALLKQQQEHIKNDIKVAHIEHEKMKHIYEKARDEATLQAQKIESKNIDEVTIMLHTRQKISEIYKGK